jgi:hypothetical protein
MSSRSEQSRSMQPVWIIVGMVAMGILALAHPGSAQEGSKVVAPKNLFEDFEIIVNRNIFDPSRQTDRRKPSPEEMSAAKAANTTGSATTEEIIDSFKGEEMALVGTLIDGPTSVAFFTSENSDFKTVAQLGESVGEFRLAEIRTECVKLENKGKIIKLPVGSRMSSQRDGEWIIAANIRSRPVPKSETEAPPPKEGSPEKPPEETTASTAASAPEAAGGGADDVLKKLMEKRRKALEK